MSKNAEGWIRHNSKQQPVDDHVEVEARTRGGDYEICEASGFAWNATGVDRIMAYRLHKPAEQVEACSKPELKINLPDGYGEICGAQSVEQGPLQWRDRIAEIDSTTQALTTERAELVQKLASEGFALIGRTVEPVEDMSDWRNWKVGDIIEMIGDGWGDLSYGGEYAIQSKRDAAISIIDDAGDNRTFTPDDDTMYEDGRFPDFKFHSRPSA